MGRWGGIEGSLKEGIGIWEMMGGGKGDENYGVGEFKGGLGGKVVE